MPLALMISDTKTVKQILLKYHSSTCLKNADTMGFYGFTHVLYGLFVKESSGEDNQ